jgi:hypothetical protein
MVEDALIRALLLPEARLRMLDEPAMTDAAPAPVRPFARAKKSRWPWALALLVPVLIVASHRVMGRSGEASDYAVSVPVVLKPHDPALWSMVNAANFEAALAIDPALPDPASVPTLGEVAPTAPPADAARLRMEAYVGPPARRHVFRGASATDTARAHYCLTAALYYEAASESDDGMRGVAQVVLNRTRHPSFPGSICGVVFQGSQRAIVCQFTFSCDGSMARAPNRSQWARASRIAAEALSGRVFAPVGLATHYHTLAVWPSWGRSLAMTNVIGAHIFHRWRGRYGEPAAFSRPYAGREPEPGPYLPIASQLAARAGRPDPLAASALPPADAAAMAAPAPGFAPAPPVARPAPGYVDPRLAGSGSVREEYRNSGAAIAR